MIVILWILYVPPTSLNYSLPNIIPFLCVIFGVHLLPIVVYLYYIN